MSQQKTLTVTEGARNVRAFIFRIAHDPYILWHNDAEQLDDEIVQAYFAEWTTRTPEFLEEENAENFEEFLYWLEREKGFVNLVAADSPYKFDLSVI